MTRNKAQHNFVHARVGKIKTISVHGDPNITYHSLLDEGYNSVKIPRVNGVEYVAYNYDQEAEVLKVEQQKWKSKW